ncbi:hypothetical protein HanIR_Chr09g0417661 [Helianthus annuus]|nr:hypothetical protein HanIR_Chr09g0417661 [Helianthus annuus]
MLLIILPNTCLFVNKSIFKDNFTTNITYLDKQVEVRQTTNYKINQIKYQSFQLSNDQRSHAAVDHHPNLQ